MKHAATAVAVTIAACLGLPVLLAGALLSGGTASAGCPATATAPTSSPWDTEQLDNAATIADTGVLKNVPRWGWTIALAVAMQESRLRNRPHLGDRNDHDSIGLFQQRPSQGWGTAAQLADPAYQAGKFYDKLLAVPGWQQMPLTRAAQAVQRSAFPDAYAKWADDATRLLEVLTGGSENCLTDVAPSLPAGFTLPVGTPPQVVTAIFWALAQLGTPYQFGGSCTAPRSGDPDRQCDCSSLMQQAYAAAGVALHRTTVGQVHDGTRIARPDQLKPGDLIFVPGSLGTADNPRHVGMYIGQGLLVQAPRSGAVVKISTVSSWIGKIAEIRRVAA
ncbi:cell wall-associated NlpC family hydrolase [Allocatelliglobosispora scoriae]|uniref:Cell wall-associated NlpC family hydrolase n=1 Tax=Allocatelliglobosispora scoriae TaxID=643052 RepID=A0A841C653_9ACTN|nr:NlpC/P60 family protein [Allocatelliglobosispora scoriae]MBB5874623.1 cell wall-associated NlpC family hydrolase [Allocatelliglobosispora scoriae]